MKNVEKQLVDLQIQIEQLTEKVSQLLAHMPAHSGFLDRQLVGQNRPRTGSSARSFTPQKGLDRFRALQQNG